RLPSNADWRCAARPRGAGLCRRLAGRNFSLDSHRARQPSGALQSQGPIAAKLAGIERGDFGQHHPGFPRGEQKLQPFLLGNGPLIMFEILRQSLKTGVVTTTYPQTPPEISSRARGKPEIDWTNWKDARPAAAICPTGAIDCQDVGDQRIARLDLAKCIFCGLCADADRSIRMTNVCECAARHRDDLVTSAAYSLKADGTHNRLVSPPSMTAPRPGEASPSQRELL